jgi:predicted metal-dependent hydrolase
MKDDLYILVFHNISIVHFIFYLQNFVKKHLKQYVKKYVDQYAKMYVEQYAKIYVEENV